MELLGTVLTIAVTLLGVAIVVLTAVEPLLVAVAEHHPGNRRPHSASTGGHQGRGRLRHRGRA